MYDDRHTNNNFVAELLESGVKSMKIWLDVFCINTKKV